MSRARRSPQISCHGTEGRKNLLHWIRIPYKKLTAQRLAEAIALALSPDAKVAAAELGRAIRKEVCCPLLVNETLE